MSWCPSCNSHQVPIWVRPFNQGWLDRDSSTKWPLELFEVQSHYHRAGVFDRITTSWKSLWTKIRFQTLIENVSIGLGPRPRPRSRDPCPLDYSVATRFLTGTWKNLRSLSGDLPRRPCCRLEIWPYVVHLHHHLHHHHHLDNRSIPPEL